MNLIYLGVVRKSRDHIGGGVESVKSNPDPPGAGNFKSIGSGSVPGLHIFIDQKKHSLKKTVNLFIKKVVENNN